MTGLFLSGPRFQKQPDWEGRECNDGKSNRGAGGRESRDIYILLFSLFMVKVLV